MRFLVALAALTLAADQSVPLSITDTGISYALLSTTPTTKAIDMEGTVSGTARVSNQLALTIAVTPGTSTAVLVKCWESSDASTWAQIGCCTLGAAATCTPDERTFTLASYATVGSQKFITTRWSVKQRYAKCSAYDAGTGRVSITGSRSWQ